MADFDRGYFVGAFRRMAATAEEHRDEWTKLDGDIGDGDHGINMSIGFREVVKQLAALPDDTDVAGLFKLVGMTLLRKVGGASGPLYGSFFMKAGAEVADQSEVSFDDLRRMLRAGAVGVVAKNDSMTDLGDAVEAALRGEPWMSPLLAQAIAADDAHRPALSDQELLALRLYACGLKLDSVARRMGVAPSTAKQYIDRVRDKYARTGQAVRTKSELYAIAVEDGFISRDDAASHQPG